MADKQIIEEWQEMINDCQERESKLTEWEEGFIDSIEEQLDERQSLSPKQVEILERIWEKATQRG